MIEVKVKIEGLEAIEAAIKKAPRETATELRGAINKSIEKLANQTVKEAPVNKQSGGGNLRQNIMYGFRSILSGIVESKAPYSAYVHEGTRPHTIEVKHKRTLANRRTGEIFGPKVQHPGTAPNPFLTRAYEKVKGQIDSYFETAIERITQLMNK